MMTNKKTDLESAKAYKDFDPDMNVIRAIIYEIIPESGSERIIGNNRDCLVIDQQAFRQGKRNSSHRQDRGETSSSP